MSKKQEKISVNLVVSYHSLKDEKDRYVFFFYSQKQELLDRYVYYSVKSDFTDFKEKYYKLVNEKNYQVKSLYVYVSDSKTKISNVKLPAGLFNGKNNIISQDLIAKFGESYKDNYSVTSKVIVKDKQSQTYQQTLISNSSLDQISRAMKIIGFRTFDYVALPDALSNFSKVNKLSSNSIIVYMEAAYVVIGALIDGKLCDCLFLDEVDHFKKEDGSVVNYDFRDIQKVFLSLVWKYQKEGVKIGTVEVISNSDRKATKFIKKENVLGLNTHWFDSTDSLFVPKNYTKKTSPKAFTLVETVVSLAVFAILIGISAGLFSSISSVNRETIVNGKVNSFINNVSEAFLNNPSQESVRRLTSYENEFDGGAHVYYVDSNVDFLSSSLDSSNKSYEITWLYNEKNVTVSENNSLQDYVEVSFSILSVKQLSNSKNYIDPVVLKVIKWKE